jgi:predicted secreted acid phosphatase
LVGGIIVKEMKVVLDKDKMPAIVVDIDGTIADIDERLNAAMKVAGVTKKDVESKAIFGQSARVFYDTLFRADLMLTDKPIPKAIRVLNQLSKVFSIFYVSSRPDDTDFDPNREIFNNTAKWIKDSGYPDGVLLLRGEGKPGGKWTKAISFHIIVMERMKEEGYQIAMAFDDLFDGKDAYDRCSVEVVEIRDLEWDVPKLCIVGADGIENCFEFV